jgi:RNA recognition motif-containing protein
MIRASGHPDEVVQWQARSVRDALFAGYGLSFSGKTVEMTNIYVGNLAYRATEDEIRQAFSRFGQVDAVQIIKDRETGRSRGFAFVEMPNAEQARQAIEQLDSTEIGGRQVKINEARPRRERY